jgi:hypothetical protein
MHPRTMRMVGSDSSDVHLSKDNPLPEYEWMRIRRSGSLLCNLAAMVDIMPSNLWTSPLAPVSGVEGTQSTQRDVEVVKQSQRRQLATFLRDGKRYAK